VRGQRFSPLLLALAVLVPVVPIVIGVLLTSGGAAAGSAAGLGNSEATGIGSPAHYRPVATTPTATSSTLSGAPSFLSQVPAGPGALVAQVIRPATMRVNPGGRPLGKVGLRTTFGSPAVLLVGRRSGNWLGVVSELAGNGRLGWIPRSATTLSRVRFEIKVSLAARRLTVLDSGRTLEQYAVAIGRPDAPTPTGRFAVTDRLATGNPSGPYGCCVIALSAHSPHAIQGWGGGTRIAIHSTPETSTIGQPVSHGCMRLTLAEGRWLMYHIPLGTPTLISG
jgi:lipoprotein-anchoring transpeptidase ErfK/SrfK